MSFDDRTYDCEALLDGCMGDVAGLRAALGESYSRIRAVGGDYGYGHHNYNTIYRTSDGRMVHAECGGCSCEGNGSWCYVESMQEAERLIPEDQRS